MFQSVLDTCMSHEVPRQGPFFDLNFVPMRTMAHDFTTQLQNPNIRRKSKFVELAKVSTTSEGKVPARLEHSLLDSSHPISFISAAVMFHHTHLTDCELGWGEHLALLL